MPRFSLLISGALMMFGSFSSSTHYQLQSYGLGSGGTNNTSSSHYTVQGSTGEVAGGTSSSTHYSTNSGYVQTEQAPVAPAPTLSNASGTYYNELNAVINTGTNPSDATYAIAISTNNFATTSYVQVDGTLNSSQFFQSYSAWGSASGINILGLAPSTTYQVAVSASDGSFTQSAYGPSASAATVSPSLIFSVSPNSQNIGTLTSGQVITGASNITYGLTTNANNGATIYAAGAYTGLYSASKNTTIPAVSGSVNLASQSHGFGLQSLSASSPLASANPFNGSGNTVGGETTTPEPMYTSSSPISNGTATADVQAKASSTDPPSNDYQEVLTFVAAASF
jgi:hypothetical protein